MSSQWHVLLSPNWHILPLILTRTCTINNVCHSLRLCSRKILYVTKPQVFSKDLEGLILLIAIMMILRPKIVIC